MFKVWAVVGPQPCFAHHRECSRNAYHRLSIRNAEALKIFEKVDTVVVDNTETLTEGNPMRVKISFIKQLPKQGKYCLQ
jgi:cation transport ATPase